MALVTDGRMSGASGKVPAAIHLSPEAAKGGPLARLRDGDMIRLCGRSGRLDAVGVDENMLYLSGMEGQPEFSEVILEGKRHSMDLAKVESEVVEVAVALVKAKPEVGAIVLECTDMPPFAHRIQQQTGLPVFDLSTLTNMVGEAVNRQPYSGILPR